MNNTLSQRLAGAQLVNQLLTQDVILKVKNAKQAKFDTEQVQVVEEYIRTQLNSLLLTLMGEPVADSLTAEELQILKAFAAKLKNASGVTLQ